MSWMRSPFYVWTDGKTVTIGADGGWGDSVRMPEEVLEDLAVMVALELLDPEEGGSPERFEAVVRRAAERYGGNVGADAAARVVGAETFIEAVDRIVATGRGGG